MSYAQNKEDLIFEHFFGKIVGTILEIGSNDGKTLSNSLYLIEKGWSAVLIEPSPQVYSKLVNLHGSNDKVWTLQAAIGEKNELATFYDSGELLKTGDLALVSSLHKKETERWASVDMPFEETQVEVITFDELLEASPHKTFDFISSDAEGNDLVIMKQIDFDKVKCRCFCIEHNSVPEVILEIQQYVTQFGFKELSRNPENIIFVR